MCAYFEPTFPFDDLIGEEYWVSDFEDMVTYEVAPWEFVSDKKIVGVSSVYDERQDVNATDWYEAVFYREAWNGYYVFTEGEMTCADGQAFTCADETICNTIPPYSNSNADGSAWTTAGVWCDYIWDEELVFEEVDCTYTFDDAAGFVFLPGDIICDLSDDYLTTTVYECKNRSLGGANCTLYSPLDASVSATDIESAWNVTEIEGTVFTEFYDFTDEWWYEEDATFEVECFDWKEAVDPYSENPFRFREYDYACDVGIVFECLNATECNRVRPADDVNGTVWYVLPYAEVPETPVWIEEVNCTVWEEGYPYMWFDAVCDDWGSLFYCADVTICPWVEPNYYDWFIWEADEESYSNIVDRNATKVIETVNCSDYWSLVDFDGLNDTFAPGDIACEMDRAFVCTVEKTCNQMSPTFAMYEGIPGWEVMEAYATVDYGDESWVEELDFSLNSKMSCTSQDYMKYELKRTDGSDVWPLESAQSD